MKAAKEYFESVWFTLGYSFRFVPRSTFLMALLYGVSGLLPYATAFLLGRVVNSVVVGAEAGLYGDIWTVLILYAFVSSLNPIFGNVQMYVNRHRMLTLQMETDLDLLRHRERIDVARYEDPKFQDLLQRTFRSGPNPIFQLVNSQFDLLRAVVGFVAGTVLSISFDPWVFVLVVLTAIPSFIADTKYAGQSWSIWAKDSPDQRRFANLRYLLINKVYLTETKLLQSGRKLLNWLRQILTDFAAKQRKLEKSRVWQTTFADLVAFAGFAVALVLMVRSVIGGDVSIGSLVYMMSTLSNVRATISNILEVVSGQYENSLIVKDIKEFVNTKPVIVEAKSPKNLELKTAPKIVFENVGFKYPNSPNWVLRNINLTIEPGEKVGLVGNNGAGKTTFVKLLCRIYDPSEGRILVNDVDLREISISEWLSYLGVLFQDYSTYDFKVKEAIAIGRPDAALDMDRVKNASSVSQSHEFIEEWRDKYEQQLGVEFSGIEPSKGQRQKLSIARIIYRNAYLMILDEPTASVDAESEAKIFDSLENLSKDTSALLISHDFSTISQCDQILVLERGKLTEKGTHNELMKVNGKYAELYNLQAERFKK